MNKIITRRRFNIVSMFTIVILLANLLIVNLVNRSLANQVPVKYDLRAEIAELSSGSNKEQGSLKDSAITQLKSHIKLGKKNGEYTSYSDDTINKLAEIEKDLDYKVKGIFPLYKEVTSNGVKYYKDTNMTEASSEDIKEQRETLKHIIMTKGGVVAYISKSGIKDNTCNSKELTTAMGDLAVVIIGWDDTFSKDNFNESIRPTSNGAFLVQSYDEVFYVSYEDIYIENNLRYIDSVEEYKEADKKEEETTPVEPEKQPEETTDPVKPDDKTDKSTEEPSDKIVEDKAEPSKQPEEEITKQDDNKPEEPTKNIIPEKPEDLDVPVEPSKPTETTKVETKSDDVLEIDTSNIKDTPVENKNVNNNETQKTINNDVPKVAKTNDVEYVDPQTVKSGKLPQTGSNTELILIVAIGAVMFMAFIVHSLRNVIKIDKNMF